MKFFQRIIAIMLVLLFCNMQVAFAVTEADALNLKDVFENNHQSIDEAHYVAGSQIEEMFNGKENKVSGTILRQKGYDHFTNPIDASSATGKYDGGYRLTIGTRLIVNAYGDSVDMMGMTGANLVTPSSQTEVSSSGAIFISGIGLIKAEGRTLSEVENDVNSIARSKYNNMRIKLNVLSGSQFPIYVYGEVGRPGKVLIGNNSTLMDALGAAGGIKKTGTLRNVMYNKKSTDLYYPIFLGQNTNIMVKPNDTIFVGKIGSVAALKNGVKEPGIYELKTGETLKDLVKYAGGLLVTTRQDDVIMTGFDKNANQKIAKTVKWDNAINSKLTNGESVEFKETYNNSENTIAIQGNIKHPATYVYHEGMRLSEILKNEDEFLEETFTNQAVIRRISGDGRNVEIIPVFLKEFFSGMNDPLLQPRDVITIYKSTNSQFVDVYGCINTPKHMPYMTNMTLADVLSNIKFMESDIKTDENEYKTSRNEGNLRLKVGTENSNQLIPTENVAVEITPPGGSTSIYYMYDLMVSYDRIKSISIAPESKVFFRTLRNNEVIKTVKVSGFVKEPGVFSFVKGQKLSDVIEMAGGLTEDANLRGIVFKRTNLKAKQTDIAEKNNERDIQLIQGKLASGYKQSEQDQQAKLDTIAQLQISQGKLSERYTGQIALNIKTGDIKKIDKVDNIEIQDGDDIYIPRMSNHVSVIGEVYNEQSFIYKNGTRVRDYIREVGGYTPNANRFRVYKVGVNGRAVRAHKRTKVYAGDTIVVPRRIAGNDWITPISAALQAFSQVFLMAFAVHKW